MAERRTCHLYMRREVHSLRNSLIYGFVSWATKFFSPRKVDFKYQSRGFLPVKDFYEFECSHVFKHASLNLQLYSWQLTICISFTLFFYHYLTVSSPFVNCLTLIINVLLTYRFTVHGSEKLAFPNIICQRHIHAQLLTPKIDHKF